MSDPNDACPTCGADVPSHGLSSATGGQRMAQHNTCPSCETPIKRFEKKGERGGFEAWQVDEARLPDEDA